MWVEDICYDSVSMYAGRMLEVLSQQPNTICLINKPVHYNLHTMECCYKLHLFIEVQLLYSITKRWNTFTIVPTSNYTNSTYINKTTEILDDCVGLINKKIILFAIAKHNNFINVFCSGKVYNLSLIHI